MNNKIFKLIAEKASKYDGDGYPCTLEYTNLFAQQYGKAVVEECINVILYEADHNFEGESEKLLRELVGWINLHFGIEK